MPTYNIIEWALSSNGAMKPTSPLRMLALLFSFHCILSTFSPQIHAQAPGPTVIWSEDFEDLDAFWEDWHTDGPFWEVGVPTDPSRLSPNSSQVAGTLINEEVTISSPTRLIRHVPITIPGTDETPRLRFSERRDLSGAPEAIQEITLSIGDTRYNFDYVQELTSPNSVDVRAITPDDENGGPDSDSIILKMNAFRPGDRLSFQTDFDRDGSSGGQDYRTILFNNGTRANSNLKVSTETQSFDFTLTDQARTSSSYAFEFESGPGTPSIRLTLSNEFNTPTISIEYIDPTVRLGSFSVLARELGGIWTSITPPRSGASRTWTESVIGLEALAGKQVELAFQVNDLTHSLGWFIDNIELITGPYEVAFPQAFENGFRGWSAESGLWHVSESQDVHSKSTGASISRLSPDIQSTPPNPIRLVSPPFQIPSSSENPRLEFWHKFQLNSGPKGFVEVREIGKSWTDLASVASGDSAVWSRRAISLEHLKNREIQLAFTLQPEISPSAPSATDPLWLIDDIDLKTGKETFHFPENFESNLNEWNITNGVWEIGAPSRSTPEALGSQRLGTVLNGNYPPGANSRAVSPPFIVPLAKDQPRLRYWTQHDFPSDDGGEIWFYPEPDFDTETGQKRPNPTRLPDSTVTGRTPQWSQASLSLLPLAGKKGRLHFVLRSISTAGGAGWLIDNIELETGRQAIRNPEGFENGLGDWSVRGGGWTAGKPDLNPPAPHSGEQLVGTILEGHYPANADYTLLSPLFRIPEESSGPAIRFWHFYDLGDGDTASVEVLHESGERTRIAGPFTNSSLDRWSNGFASLSNFRGQGVQVGFRLDADGTMEGPGWFLDDIRLQTNILKRMEDLTIAEGETVSLLLDQPATGLELNLELISAQWDLPNGAPAEAPTAEGASLQSQLGIFNWVTGESNGPATYTFRIELVDPESSWNPIDFRDFDVTVTEVSQAPVFDQAPGSILFEPGTLIRTPVQASDPDVPSPPLTYTLDQAPAGAVIDNESGLFVWRPNAEQATKTYTIIVRATDTGENPLSTIHTFTAIPEALAGPAPSSTRVENGKLIVEFERIKANTGYQLLHNADLSTPFENWEAVQRLEWSTAPFHFEIPLENNPTGFYGLKPE